MYVYDSNKMKELTRICLHWHDSNENERMKIQTNSGDFQLFHKHVERMFYKNQKYDSIASICNKIYNKRIEEIEYKIQYHVP